jgi:plasmid stabilization system protein ParE
MKVIWSTRAKAELSDILLYLENTFGEKTAAACFNDVFKILNQIAHFPTLFKTLDDNKTRQAVVHKNLSVFYRIDSNSIQILSCWDNRRDPENIFL